ncbi:papain-like cysteine protease family protein [Thalassospira xiamenensis]|uniref:papain-like cysteine protease family protein n=1 Tax=Thalassospira xiamenensis TaxID=220697 RepID=UPI0007A47114|nr:papain-like cysteine protease family protein [Thalassospira xiamenensis]
MKRFLVAMLLFLGINQANAQQLPPPIDLGIVNIPQQTQVWCWVAVVEQITHWKSQTHPNTSPHQCQLVSVANGMSQPTCCNSALVMSNPMLADQCIRTGHDPEIMQLLSMVSNNVAGYGMPAHPMVLYNTLASGRPIILKLQNTPFSGHVVVLRGMAWVQTPMGPTAVLYINDPLSYFTQPVPFQNIAHMWSGAFIAN